MEKQPTCGQGLAEHALLPAKMGALTAAVAKNLELHMTTLDLSDEHAKQEYEAYEHLVNEHRQIASQLQLTAEQMAQYRDLPMGRHDHQAMATPAIIEAFAQFVKLEHELLALLQQRVGQDQQLLSEMGEAGV